MSHRVETITLDSASPGTRREITVHRFGTPGARPKAYFQASLHADELPAMLVAHHLLRRLIAADAEGAVTGEIILVPAVNPIGMSQTVNGYLVGRYDLSGDLNFNRNWPDLAPDLAKRVGPSLGADPDRNATLIRAALHEALETFTDRGELASLRRAVLRLAIDADLCFDLHCDNEALMHLYIGERMWPALADLSAEIGSRATMLSDDSGGEPFDECVGGLWFRLHALVGPETPVPVGCLSGTIEYRGKADFDDRLAEPDADALMRFLIRQGVVRGEAGAVPAPQCEAVPLSAVDTVRAPVAGLIAYRVPLGAEVRAGDVIADILDPMAADPDQARVPVTTSQNGVVLSRLIVKIARAGEVIAKIVGREPLDYRTGALMEP